MDLFTRGKQRIFWYEYRDPVSGKRVRRSLGVTSRRQAEILARELCEQILRRRHGLAERKPWGEAVQAYLQ